MTGPLDPAGSVQAELSAHKAVAAGVAAFLAVVTSAVLLGAVHGTAQVVCEVVLGAATLLGVTGAVYQTPARVLAIRHVTVRTVHPMPGPTPDPCSVPHA